MAGKGSSIYALAAAAVAAAAPAGGPLVEYRSAAGVESRAQRGTGAIARAESAPAELAGATDWLWMALSRAGRAAEAQAMLDRHPDSLAATNAYAQRLRLYRGQIGPDDVITAADTGDVALATLSYGVGNWYLVRGDTGQARAWFERSVRSGGWPAFGFIMSEVELRRLSAQATGQRTREQIRASYDAHQGDFDYLLGDWEFSSVSREFGKGRGYWSAVRLAEGAQVLDEYRVVSDIGETYYVTNTLHAYNAVLDQ